MKSTRFRTAAAVLAYPLLVGCFAGPAPAPAADRVASARLGPATRPVSLTMDEIAVMRPATSGAGRVDLRVERLWSENGATWATVSVRNLASFDLVKVTVACTALGAGEAFDVARHTIVAPGEGPMPPGSAKIANVSLAAHRPDVESVSCEARAL